MGKRADAALEAIWGTTGLYWGHAPRDHGTYLLQVQRVYQRSRRGGAKAVVWSGTGNAWDAWFRDGLGHVARPGVCVLATVGISWGQHNHRGDILYINQVHVTYPAGWLRKVRGAVRRQSRRRKRQERRDARGAKNSPAGRAG